MKPNHLNTLVEYFNNQKYRRVTFASQLPFLMVSLTSHVAAWTRSSARGHFVVQMRGTPRRPRETCLPAFYALNNRRLLLRGLLDPKRVLAQLRAERGL